MSEPGQVPEDRLRYFLKRVTAELHDTREALERSYMRPTYRLREKVVRRLESGRAGRVAMRVYRVARGRSSRSA